jgi:hypothetical protein
MMDRQKLETLLSRRFPGASRDQVAAAANAIMGLEDEWEEVTPCAEVCVVAREAADGGEFRLLRRRAT